MGWPPRVRTNRRTPRPYRCSGAQDAVVGARAGEAAAGGGGGGGGAAAAKQLCERPSSLSHSCFAARLHRLWPSSIAISFAIIILIIRTIIIRIIIVAVVVIAVSSSSAPRRLGVGVLLCRAPTLAWRWVRQAGRHEATAPPPAPPGPPARGARSAGCSAGLGLPSQPEVIRAMNVGGWSVFAEWTVEAAILPADGDDALDRMGIFPGSRRGRTSMDKEAMDKGKQWTSRKAMDKESNGRQGKQGCGSGQSSHLSYVFPPALLSASCPMSPSRHRAAGELKDSRGSARGDWEGRGPQCDWSLAPGSNRRMVICPGESASSKPGTAPAASATPASTSHT